MTIRSGFRRVSDDDEGLTLIEVMIALFVFSIIAMMVAYTLTSSLVRVRESRSREIAVNLAAQEIDYDRSIGNVFSVDSDQWSQVVNGTTFTITRSSDWVTANNSTVACGAGGGTLQYKRVNISVDWVGRTTGTNKVTSSSIISPNNRINDPNLGTIIVSVTSSTGAGAAGVTATVAPSATNANGAAVLSAQPAATDSNGCTYALKVTPGNYDVTLSTPNYVDINQNPTPVLRTVTVSQGSVGKAPFTYDSSALYTLQYAGATVPTNLPVTYVNVVGGAYTKIMGSAGTVRLFPFSDGYSAFAGAYVAPIGTNPSCVNVDPGSWTTPASGDGATGKALGAGTAAAPGGSASMPVASGVVTVTGLTAGQYVTAVLQSPVSGSGDPGCSTGTPNLTFSAATAASMTYVLPFGSWKLYSGSSSGSTANSIPTTRMTPVSRAILTPSLATITLDPRTVG
ncbi:MAG: type II secretion system protein [Leifsonia sp.]